MALHEVQLKGYSVRPCNLSLGTFDSYGIEQLHVTLDDTWSGLAVTATFNPPKGEPVEIRVPENGLIDVPAEATANEGTGAIVYCGVANGVQLITKTQGYNVITHGNVGRTEPFNPSESLATQVLQAALNAEKNSAEANTAAQSAQTAAENATAAAQASAESASKAAAEAAAAKPYAESAKASAEAARDSENQAQQSSAEANTAKNAAQNAQAGAESSATAAAKSAKEAAASAVNLDSAANTATQKAAAASASAAAAKASESAAASSEAAARKYANSAESAAKTAGEAAAAAAKAKTAAESAQADAAASKSAAANSATQANQSANAAANSAAAAKTSEDAAAKSAADANSTANSINNSMMQIAALQKRQNVLVGSETGNPVSCNDAYSAPLCGLTVYGKSTQDGTPSPDNPVPIVSAGDGGSVAVKVTGKNLLNIPDGSATARGVTVTAKDGLISISGTAISSGYAWSNIQPFITSGVVILSSSITSPKVKLVSEIWGVVLTHGIADKMSNMATRIVFIVTEGQTYNLTGVKVQLELGTTATAYSPYREQLLTLPTPNGLPGIPVTSGGNYTDQNGQQWVCDEVDLERGVKVQRIDKTSFDNTKTLAEQNATLATPIETPLTPAEIAAYKALTAYAPDTVVQASDGAGVKLDYQRDVNIAIKNLEDAIASMTTT